MRSDINKGHNRGSSFDQAQLSSGSKTQEFQAQQLKLMAASAIHEYEHRQSVSDFVQQLNAYIDNGWSIQTLNAAKDIIENRKYPFEARILTFAAVLFSNLIPDTQFTKELKRKLSGINLNKVRQLHGSTYATKDNGEYAIKVRLSRFPSLLIVAEGTEALDIGKSRFGLNESDVPDSVNMPYTYAFIKLEYARIFQADNCISSIPSQFVDYLQSGIVIPTLGVDYKHRDRGHYSALIKQLCTSLSFVHQIYIDNIIQYQTKSVLERGGMFLETILGKPFAKCGFSQERIDFPDTSPNYICSGPYANGHPAVLISR